MTVAGSAPPYALMPRPRWRGVSSTDLHPWLEIDLERARRVITRFLGAYLDDAGADGLVVGLSGGLDSAMTAALASQALGPEAIDAVTLPGPTSSPEDREVAEVVADHLGLDLAEVAIGPAAEALLDGIGVEADQMVTANLQARLRMTVSYARAQAAGRLVAGTGNKSELMVGYFTKHGDGGVDLLPIGDLYKTQLRILAREMGLPEAVVTRPPTAGLWQGQTDESELGMSYATLDVILAGIERQAEDEAIGEAADVVPSEVQRVRGMVRSSWHKRNPPPVPKLGWRTPLVDWREPTM